ncbi:DsbC family protein [Azospirillum sp. SYSU D00513]|uniref:DsbC family protein n=1 Tax=Azospirillum sp. SYSU D00513 TaxID=2812561 RepID=UPI001A979C61|nr:DsbC family protein [Azospirillum sp. SYSU D00513]
MRFALAVTTVLAALTLGQTGTAIAQTQGQSEAAISRSTLTGNIRAMEKLPSGGFTAVETDATSSLVFISDNGRYVIRGDLYDTWSGKKVATLGEIRDSATRVDFAKLGINLNDLGALTYGTGSRQAVIFVDPKCPYCHGVLQQLPALAGKYTFKIMVVPVLGKESETLTRMISCASDQRAALASVLAANTRDTLPQQEPCNLVPIQKRLVTSQLVGVKGVPFMVAPDGRTKGGMPKDLDSWLEGRS